MHPKEKHKVCTQCDGRIPVDAQLCPYCAAEQTLSQPNQHHRSLQDSLSSPYNPPYTSKPQPAKGFDKQMPYQMKTPEKKYTPPLKTKAPQEAEALSVEPAQSSFWPILMLSIGANLLVIGLLQLFFSDNGILRLEWDSSRWFIYCLAALPLCYLGLQKAKQLK